MRVCVGPLRNGQRSDLLGGHAPTVRGASREGTVDGLSARIVLVGTKVGRLEKGTGVFEEGPGGRRPLKARGFDHFSPGPAP